MEPQTQKSENSSAYRDKLVAQLPEKLGFTSELPPEQKMAKLLALGARTHLKNCCVDGLNDQNTPTLTGINSNRPMILLFGNILGPRLGVESVRFAMENALKIEGLNSQKTEPQYMLAYPHMEKSELIAGQGISNQAKQAGVKEITFMTVTQKQMDVLRTFTTPPVAPVPSGSMASKA